MDDKKERLKIIIRGAKKEEAPGGMTHSSRNQHVTLTLGFFF